MKRKFAIAFILGGILVTGLSMFLAWMNKSVEGQITDGPSSDLSNRIKTIGGGTLRESDLGGGVQQAEVVTDCFRYEYVTQFSPKTEISDKGCVVRSGLREPRGQLTVSWQELASSQAFNEYTGYTLRKSNPDQYIEFTVDDENFLQVIGFTADREVTLFAVQPSGVITISVHSLQSSLDDGKEAVLSILKTVKLK